MHSGVPPALIACAVVAGSAAWLGVRAGVPLLVAAYCGTYLVYRFDRTGLFSSEDALNRPRPRTAWRSEGVSLLGAGVAGGWAAWELAPSTWPILAVLAGLTMAYVAPVLPGRRRLKDLGPAKPFVIAACWALGGVGVPAMQATLVTEVKGWDVLALGVLRGGVVLANTLLTDWPDREGDLRFGIATPAARMGLVWTRRCSVAALVAAALAVVAWLWGNGLGEHATWLALTELVGLGLMGVAVVRYDGRGWTGVWLDVAVAWPAVTALVLRLVCAG